MSGSLRTLDGGSGPGLLLLLHGLGATADVWTPMAPVLAQTWRGRWLAVDLPGHGGSAPLPRVSFGALAARPAPWFDTREQAAARHLRVAGLTGLVDPADDVVTAGLREQDGRWRLALDPRSFAVGAPDLPGLLAAARSPVVLARGEHDPMVSTEQLAELVADPVVLPDCGHNAHVEQPELVARLLTG